MNGKNRFLEIDLIRGFSILIVIITHTTVYFLSTPGVSEFWNLIHFSVPLFVFCSGYVLLRNNEKSFSLRNYALFLKKRFIRLLKPFYLFLGVFFLVELIQNHFKIRNVVPGLLVWYPDISWLVILFLELTVLFPFLNMIIQKKTLLFGWLSFATLISMLFIFWNTHLDYRLTMIVPWTIPFLLGGVFKKLEEAKKTFWIIYGLLFLLFAVQFILLTSVKHDLFFQHNKYPPNSFYLNYGLLWLFGLYKLFKMPFIQNFTKSWLPFFSVNSYPLFFIHFIIISLVFYQHAIRLNVWSFTGLVLGASILVQILINYIYARFTFVRH